jgi:hypothetical protein
MKKISNILPILFFMGMIIWGCNKEDALEPSADFTLGLTDNTGYVKEPLTLYLTNVVGDFITLYRGDYANNTYNKDSAVVKGIAVDKSADSISMTYNNAGVYQLTLLTATCGNWSADYFTDVKTVQVTIVDRRTEFKKFAIDKVNGKLSEDGTEFYFLQPKYRYFRRIHPMPWYILDRNCRNPEHLWLIFLPYLPVMRKEDRLNIKLWRPMAIIEFIQLNISCTISRTAEWY